MTLKQHNCREKALNGYQKGGYGAFTSRQINAQVQKTAPKRRFIEDLACF